MRQRINFDPADLEREVRPLKKVFRAALQWGVSCSGFGREAKEDPLFQIGIPRNIPRELDLSLKGLRKRAQEMRQPGYRPTIRATVEAELDNLGSLGRQEITRVLPSLSQSVRISGTTYVIGQAIAAYADEVGHCWPSMSRLACDTGFHRATIGIAVRALVHHRLIDRTWRKKPPPSREYSSNLYTLRIPRIPSLVVEANQSSTARYPAQGRPIDRPLFLSNLRRLLQCRLLTGYGVRLGEVLLEYSNAYGVCVLTHAQLMRIVGCSERTVRRKLAHLAELGLVTWRRSRRANVYELHPLQGPAPEPVLDKANRGSFCRRMPDLKLVGMPPTHAPENKGRHSYRWLDMDNREDIIRRNRASFDAQEE